MALSFDLTGDGVVDVTFVTGVSAGGVSLSSVTVVSAEVTDITGTTFTLVMEASATLTTSDRKGFDWWVGDADVTGTTNLPHAADTLSEDLAADAGTTQTFVFDASTLATPLVSTAGDGNNNTLVLKPWVMLNGTSTKIYYTGPDFAALGTMTRSGASTPPVENETDSVQHGVIVCSEGVSVALTENGAASMSGENYTYAAGDVGNTVTFTFTATGTGMTPVTDPDTTEEVQSAVNVVLLAVNDNAANGTTTFADDSPASHTITPSGDTVYSNATAPSGMTTVGAFDGTGDYLTTDSHADYGYGSNDFTIEFMFRTTTLAALQVLIDQRVNDADVQLAIYVNTAGVLAYQVAGTNRITSAASAVAINTWYHVAASRVSGTTRLFLAGTQVGSNYTDANSYITSKVRMGASRTAGTPLTGYMCSVRVINGTGLYTTGFTPPSLPLS